MNHDICYGEGRGSTILVAEDSEMDVFVLRRAFAKAELPHKLLFVHDGQEAINYLQGIKITDYCDEHNLSTKERLELFIQVCHAVQHAHQKGIIHRDLKPSNILIASNDGVPVPKVIDFGRGSAQAPPLRGR